MDRIRDWLYLGSAADSANLPALQGAGVNAVLNVADDVADPNYWRRQMLCVKVGLSDDMSIPQWLIEQACQVLGVMRARGMRVLVHCRYGMRRAPIVATTYLSGAEGRACADVFEELRRLRPAIPAWEVLLT
jgi:protein-tyrosine phosphatase